MNQTAAQTDDPIDFLSLRLFPAKHTIRAKAELLGAGKREEAFAYIKDIEDFEAELSQLSAASLKALIDDEHESDEVLEKAKAEQEENSRFFYDPSAHADYRIWIQRETWTVDEATALLLGKNPDVVNWHSINPLVYKSKFAKRYADLRQQIKKADENEELHKSHMPAAYLLFAKSSGFALPAELDALASAPGKTNGKVEVNGQAAAEAKPDPQEQERALSVFQNLIAESRKKLETDQPGTPGTGDKPAPAAEPAAARNTAETEMLTSMVREREMLLRMLGSLAIGGYGFDPAASDEDAANRIADDLRTFGLSANPAIVRKLIGDAARMALARKPAG